MLDHLRGQIRRDRREAELHHRRATHYERQIAHLQAQEAAVVARRHHLGHEEVLDGTPTFLVNKLFLLDCREHGWDGVLVSSDRRREVEPLLHKLGKSGQAELIRLHEENPAEFAPADSYDTSSHTLHSDGVSYPHVPAGGLLRRFEVGMDTSAWDQLLAVAHDLGYHLRQPYPGTDEAHHMNLTEDPKAHLIKRGRL
jgi:hypothetical protein